MRLATFNILHAARLSDRTVDLDLFTAAVRSLDADVLALQEVDRGQPRSGGVDLAALAAEAMGAVAFRFVPVVPGLLGVLGAEHTGGTAPQHANSPEPPGYGIALLSRFPAREWHELTLPRLPFRYPAWQRARRRFRRSSDEPRGAVLAVLDTPDGPLRVANAHLSYLPGVRRRQLLRLRDWLAGCPDPLVLMGDFNHRAPHPARITGFRPLASHPTFPAGLPRRQIDHILTRDHSLRVLGSSVHEFAVSDHCALAVDVSW